MNAEVIGVFDAKTHLSEFIEQVEQGRTFIISKRGRRVAQLCPMPADKLPLLRGCAATAGIELRPDFDGPAEGGDEEELWRL